MTLDDQKQVFASGCFGIMRIWPCAIWWPLKSSATKSSSPKIGEAGFHKHEKEPQANKFILLLDLMLAAHRIGIAL